MLSFASADLHAEKQKLPSHVNAVFTIVMHGTSLFCGEYCSAVSLLSSSFDVSTETDNLRLELFDLSLCTGCISTSIS